MVGLTYDTYRTQLALLAVVPADDTNFLTALPSAISYAELRIYRDLDFLQTQDAEVGQIDSGERKLQFDEGTFVVTEQVNILLPAGTSDPEVAERVALTPVTKEYLDAVHGNPSYKGVPSVYAPFNDNLLLVGPYADAAYYAEVVGTVRPAPLSQANPTTFISQYLPDLFLMASMVYISGYQRNFGRQSDDPSMAQSYESQYQALKQGATIEEARKKYQASAWSSEGPSPVATPSR